jgi:radical SAM superfamily enzyme YgiQ (UPF0313 family)
MVVCLATQHRASQFIPLALLYLKAALVERGGCRPEDVAIAEFDRDATVDTIVEAVLATAPDIVGLSCYVWNITNLLAAARAIKSRRPATRIVLGGPEVGPVAEDVLRRNPFIDVIVKSEGELPLLQIVTASEVRSAALQGCPSSAVLQGCPSSAALQGCPGICFRDGDAIVDTGEAPLLKDVNELPSPHLHRYGDLGKRVICLETQRGCVFRCSFCFYNKDFALRNRRFDLDRVKEEIAYWLEQDVLEIYLMDPVFNLNAARTKEICRFIAAHNRRRVRFHAEIWAEFVDEEMASLMRDAHFEFLEVGLQTTDTTALATVERRLKLQKFIDGMSWLKQYGLPHELQLIYGLPGETRASFARSLDFAMSLDPHELAVFPLMVLPGTELWRNAAALQLTFDPTPPYFVQSHLSMTAADFEYGRRLVDACGALSKSRTARLLARERGLTFSQLVDAWIECVGPNFSSADEHRGSNFESAAMKRFFSHICDTRAIPSAFYDKFAALEFA